METLIVAAEHRSQYYGNKSLEHDGFRSSPSTTYRQINCRTFHSGVGLLPRPKRTSSTPTPKVLLPQLQSVDSSRTYPITIANSKDSQLFGCCSEFVDERRSLSYSELWAGPTYSNSPPPTSVPIPKFSLRQRRTVSLTFPGPDSAVYIPDVAKSAPVSPTSSCVNNPFHSTVSATMALRRMLNLETADE